MRNILNFFIGVALVTGTAAVQAQTKDVSDILSEMSQYSTAPAAEKPAMAQPEETAPAQEADVDAMMEKSRTKMLGGDITEALKGFADVVTIDPENSLARMYLRTLQERDQRTMEVDGMAAVDAAWSTDLVLRSYTLADGASERMKLNDATGPVDVGTLFPQVEFPEDSSAIYQPKTDTIFVRNTPDNLAVLETMFETMGVLKKSAKQVEQIEIEAKFVEVSEGALEELGFQWNFDGAVGVGDVDVSDGAGGLFSKGLRGSPSAGAPAMPFLRNGDLGAGSSAASGNWSTFRFEDTFNQDPAALGLRYEGGDAFDLMISALDQTAGTDVLSAPRVVTRSGEEATLRVGELHYFPEVYEGDSAQATILNISYEDFEEKLLGVEMTVTPLVKEQDIMLQLNPRITELAGWRNYQLAPANSIYNHRQLDRASLFTHPEIVAKLPIFKKREIETEVTIANGSTIGMGGLINEKIVSYEDKVPVLGHLPLVGRLFRNEGERTEKRNLLIFVTAKMVEANGRVDTSRSFE
jgi:type II secretory pathway component GspD/PulD (secretin)